MYYSPLRYPGGKSKLAPFMECMMKRLNHNGGTYIEPFAGGAGIAIELLEKQFAQRIVLNDYDKGIYSFWRAVLSDTDRFISDIRNVPLTIDEWRRNHNICINDNNRYSYELGFATFYMNRTNRSGIIKGGVIGGIEQNGKWKMDVRFNREHLIDRILKIAKNRDRISLYNKDVRSFIQHYLPKYQDNALVYFDPPYYHKGHQLYLNFFNHNDHDLIRNMITNTNSVDWIITYDDTPEIRKLYEGQRVASFELDYSASRRRQAHELIIFKPGINVPTNQELEEENIFINLNNLDLDK